MPLLAKIVISGKTTGFQKFYDARQYFLVSGSQSIGLHHKFVKFLRFLDTPEVPTALTQEILEIEIIYDAGQYFLISESQNIGPHHKFLEFLKYLDKPRSVQPLHGKS